MRARNWFGLVVVLTLIGNASVPARAQATWTDPATGLMWAKQDNGQGVNWIQANNYCANLHLGGYSVWRLPTVDELQSIYDPNQKSAPVTWHIKGGIQLSMDSLNCVWSSSASGPQGAWAFTFLTGEKQAWAHDSGAFSALCVRHP